jgi:hypothetical protein
MCTSCALFFSSEEDSVQGTPLTGLTLCKNQPEKRRKRGARRGGGAMRGGGGDVTRGDATTSRTGGAMRGGDAGRGDAAA